MMAQREKVGIVGQGDASGILIKDLIKDLIIWDNCKDHQTDTILSLELRNQS